MSIRSRVLALVEQSHMTPNEIARELHVSRSSAVNALMDLKKDGKVCIARYQYTGVKPVAYWGVGNVDAPRPLPQSKEEHKANRREQRRRQRELEEQLARAQEFKPRRDIAASWIPRM